MNFVDPDGLESADDAKTGKSSKKGSTTLKDIEKFKNRKKTPTVGTPAPGPMKKKKFNCNKFFGKCFSRCLAAGVIAACAKAGAVGRGIAVGVCAAACGAGLAICEGMQLEDFIGS